MSAASLAAAKEHHRAGRLEEAEQHYRDALSQDPSSASAWNGLGLVQVQRGDVGAALASLQAALRLMPGSAPLWLNCGAALQALRRPAEALTAIDRSLALAPDLAEAHFNRGLVLRELRRPDEALDSFGNVLAVQPAHRAARNNSLALLVELGRYAQAAQGLERHLADVGPEAEALTNLALARQNLGDPGSARALFNEALGLQPGNRGGGWNLALLDLREGRFASGFEGYEAFWPGDTRRHPTPRYDVPLWRGDEAMAGKTLLLHADEGHGDTIQYLRFVERLAPLGARVLVRVQDGLGAFCRGVEPSFEGLDPFIQILEARDGLPSFDLHCPLHALPHRLRVDASSFNQRNPYVRADPARASAWRLRLAALGEGPRVGLCWAGSPAHPDDARRSMPLADLLPLTSVDGIHFVSLQRELRPGDAERLEAPRSPARLGEDVADFAELAALVSALDCVVTVDTAVAHVAGALGRPVWLLLAKPCDWRWMSDRADTPWYPSAKLFRQEREGDWAGLVERVRRELGMIRGPTPS